MAQDEDLFTELSAGSFDGYAIPVVSVQILTGSAAAFHKFPYRPGQRVEYTGREPVTGTLTAAFFSGIEDDIELDEVVWPDSLQLLRRRVQEQRSGPLVLPPLGLLPLAYVTMSEDYGPDAREGSHVTIHFQEDNEDLFASGLKLPSARGRMASAAMELMATNQPANVFNSLGGSDDDGNLITDLSEFVANIGGNIDRFQDDLARPVSQVTGLVRRIDDLLQTFTSAENWPVRNALLDLRDASIAALDDLRGATRKVIRLTIAGPSNLAAIAQITGNTVSELLQLNVIRDGNRLNAGDLLFVYDNAS